MKMSISRLYRTLASRACSSPRAYSETTPGVASGTLVNAICSLGARRIGRVRTKQYRPRPAPRMIHSKPAVAVAWMDCGSVLRYRAL